MLILNGVLMSEAAATLPATDRALTHGLGLYETIKLEDGVPVFFEEHVARLVHGIAALGLDKDIDKPSLAEEICRLSEANGGAHNSCRLLVTAGAPDGSPSLLIQTDRRDFPDRPLRVISYRGVRVSAQYKAMTVMQSTFAQRAARAAGVDDAILVDGEGRIFEGATSNVFVVRAGGLITPPAEGDILPGVLRAKVEQAGDCRRHPRRGGVGARRRPAPGRRRAAHQQRPRRRAGGARRRRAAPGARAGADQGAIAGRGGRGGERHRLSRRLPAGLGGTECSAPRRGGAPKPCSPARPCQRPRRSLWSTPRLKSANPKEAPMAHRGMRRGDKEIVDQAELHRILDEAKVMRLGMLDGERPYVVPLNFARDGDEIWFHAAQAGRKLDCLRAAPAVCVEADRLLEIHTGPSACDDWTSYYESVIGSGTAEIVEDKPSKLRGLRGHHAQVLGTGRLGVRRRVRRWHRRRACPDRLSHREALAGARIGHAEDARKQ